MFGLGALLTGIALMGGSAHPSVQSDERVWVNVVRNGRTMMNFVPAEDRSGASSRGVCSEVTEAQARTTDGKPIRGFELTGWKQGDHYRVRVYAVVPAQDLTGTRGICSPGSGYKLVEFDDVLIAPGQEIALQKMEGAGLKPWALRAGRRES